MKKIIVIGCGGLRSIGFRKTDLIVIQPPEAIRTKPEIIYEVMYD